MRILHFADLHLDASFQGISKATTGGGRPQAALRRCLERIVALAREHAVDAVTIGGDLYEHERRSADTGNFIEKQLASIAPTPVLIAPGNHDPLKPSSLYRQVVWPANVHIFPTQELTPHILDGNVTVWGAAYPDSYWPTSPLAAFRAPAGGTHILLLHATATDRFPQADNRYCPITEAEARRAGFRAALLGHIHNPSPPTDSQFSFYPGSPEPLNFGEAGRHHVLLFELGADSLRVRPLQVNQVQFGTLDIAVDDMGTSESARSAILEEAQRRSLLGGIVRAYLRGTQHPDIELDARALAEELAPHFGYLDVVDESEPPYDYQALAHGHTARAYFVRHMVSLVGQAPDGEEQLCEEALVLGLRAFEKKPLRPRQRALAQEESV